MGHQLAGNDGPLPDKWRSLAQLHKEDERIERDQTIRDYRYGSPRRKFIPERKSHGYPPQIAPWRQDFCLTPLASVLNHYCGGQVSSHCRELRWMWVYGVNVAG